MIDSVLKGTGNSRFLKSAVPAGTSWADALAMLQAGTFPIDFNGINTEGFQQVGTPLNKANLLKDATAAQIGLPPSTTPDGMFQALAKTGDLHVWKKTVKNSEDVPAGYTLGDVQTGNFKFVADSYRTFEFGTPSVDDAGNVGLNVEGSVNGRNNSNFDILKGKFCRPSDSTWYIDASLGSQVIYIPADATFSQSGSYKYVDKYQLVTGYPLTPAGTTTTYPVSTNPNAYQEGDDAKAAGYVLGDVVTGSFRAGATNYTISYGYETASELTVSDDGRTVSMTSPSAGSFGFMGGLEPGDNPAKIRAFMLGKFVRCTTKDDQLNEAPDTKYPFNTIPSDIVYIPSNAQITIANGDVLVDRYQPVTGYAAIPAGTTIEYLGKLGDKARVQVVSYVGTGTYGESNPCSLTFDFVPKVAMMLYRSNGSNINNSAIYSRFFPLTTLTTSYKDVYFAQLTANGNNGRMKISEDRKTVSWFNTYGAYYQENESGMTYVVAAIG